LLIYSNDNQSLFAVDLQSRTSAFVQAESGGKPFGDPIPEGKFAILERAGRDGFFRLESLDGSFGDDSTPGNRTKLRLHGPGRTIGCIAICSKDGLKSVDSLLKSTSTTTSKVDSKTLSARIFGGQETVKNFGKLFVLPSGSSVQFNEKTGEVSIRSTETGSRIQKSKVLCTVDEKGACR
jgi:hypothetical protein